MGLANAPSHFQRLMDLVLTGKYERRNASFCSDILSMALASQPTQQRSKLSPVLKISINSEVFTVMLLTIDDSLTALPTLLVQFIH
jgi:hypothetical protein